VGGPKVWGEDDDEDDDTAPEDGNERILYPMREFDELVLFAQPVLTTSLVVV